MTWLPYVKKSARVFFIAQHHHSEWVEDQLIYSCDVQGIKNVTVIKNLTRKSYDEKGYDSPIYLDIEEVMRLIK